MNDGRVSKSLASLNKATVDVHDARQSKRTDQILAALALIEIGIDCLWEQTDDLDEINEKLDHLDIQLNKLMQRLKVEDLG